jgi:hypothetical protein
VAAPAARRYLMRASATGQSRAAAESRGRPSACTLALEGRAMRARRGRRHMMSGLRPVLHATSGAGARGEQPRLPVNDSAAPRPPPAMAPTFQPQGQLMSMIGYLTQLPPALLEKIEKKPHTIPAVLADNPTLSLGKMWNGLQFLLDHYLPPRIARHDDADQEDTERFFESMPLRLDEAVIGGDVMGPDLCYGPACILSPEDVQEIAGELALVEEDALRHAFDPSAMQRERIYPSGIWTEGEPVLAELVDAFTKLAAFYREAAAAGNGMATYLS